MAKKSYFLILKFIFVNIFQPHTPLTPFYRNLRGTQYSEGRPYESYFDYPNDTREDFFLDSDHKRGDVDEQLIKAFEDQHLDDARDHRETTDDERPHEQDVRYQEVNYKENKTNKLNGYYE